MSIRTAIKGEPVAIVGSLVTAYHTIVAAVLAFGWADWTVEQVVAAEAAVVALLAVPVTLLVRNSVTPNVNIPDLVQADPHIVTLPSNGWVEAPVEAPVTAPESKYVSLPWPDNDVLPPPA